MARGPSDNVDDTLAISLTMTGLGALRNDHPSY